jgi:hypothetical protein
MQDSVKQILTLSVPQAGGPTAFLEKKPLIHSVILERHMKRKFFCLAGVYVLFSLIPGRDLGETTPGFIPGIQADSIAPTPKEAKARDAGGTAYYVDCGAAKKDGDGRSPAAVWHSLDAVTHTPFYRETPSF